MRVSLPILAHNESRPMSIFNKKYLLKYRRKLRNHGTAAEAVLWTYINKRQLKGRKFRRQHSIGNYIVDFYCPSEKLVIELDGPYHNQPNQAEYDAIRTAYLESVGLKVIRIENDALRVSIEQILNFIESHFKETTSQDNLQRDNENKHANTYNRNGDS